MNTIVTMLVGYLLGKGFERWIRKYRKDAQNEALANITKDKTSMEL